MNGSYVCLFVFVFVYGRDPGLRRVFVNPADRLFANAVVCVCLRPHFQTHIAGPNHYPPNHPIQQDDECHMPACLRARQSGSPHHRFAVLPASRFLYSTLPKTRTLLAALRAARARRCAVFSRPTACPGLSMHPKHPSHVPADRAGRLRRPKRHHAAPPTAHCQSPGVRLTRGPSGGPHS